MENQLDILRAAVELLGKLADASSARFAAVERKDIRRSFINRHGWNIYDIANDVLVLGEHGDLRSIYLLSRPALESLFKLAASVTTADFAAQKAVAELKEERDRIEKWISAGTARRDELKQVEAGLREYEQELRTRYGVKSQNQWNAKQMADAGSMTVSYVGDYFLGSLHIHAVLKALVDREDALYIPAGVYGVTTTVTHACALLNKALMDLENCAAPNVFEQCSDMNARAKKAYESELASRIP